MIRVLVVSRDVEDAISRASRLQSRGFEASAYPTTGTRGFRGIRQDPPQVIVIDLIRMPSYGRAMGVLLRQQKQSGLIPLVFVEGDPAKAALVRSTLPDAIYTSWAKLDAAIRKASAAPLRTPVVPRLPENPVVRKLGIVEDSKVAMLHAPIGFVPPGGVPVKRAEEADVVLSFHQASITLTRDLPAIAGMMRKGRKVWVLWPKKAAGTASDLSMPSIRDMASGVGLVDYKVCSVDATWSGMLLGKRR